jgi:uncharacterized protein
MFAAVCPRSVLSIVRREGIATLPGPGSLLLHVMAPLPKLATITALNIYPVKSCGGIALTTAQLTSTGFAHDRQWLIVQPNGRFVTQREQPRLALIRPTLHASSLTLQAPEQGPLEIGLTHDGEATRVQCWKDECAAIDAGDDAARWLERYLGQPHRLVRFDPAFRRRTDPSWTGDIEAHSQFSDGFPWLLISQASLQDLNSRLDAPLPMTRFRPNIVVDGLKAFEEDSIEELTLGSVALRPVKPCTRCAITTTDQLSGQRVGDEPLRTLRTYRFDRQLKGVTFGQNVILRRGVGDWLRVGDAMTLAHRAS